MATKRLARAWVLVVSCAYEAARPGEKNDAPGPPRPLAKFRPRTEDKERGKELGRGEDSDFQAGGSPSANKRAVVTERVLATSWVAKAQTNPKLGNERGRRSADCVESSTPPWRTPRKNKQTLFKT